MIGLRSPREIKARRNANRIFAEILAELEACIVPGIITMELNKLGESLAEKNARPSWDTNLEE